MEPNEFWSILLKIVGFFFFSKKSYKHKESCGYKNHEATNLAVKQHFTMWES